jgi:imidazolonepropionase-like amidohydrolase
MIRSLVFAVGLVLAAMSAQAGEAQTVYRNAVLIDGSGSKPQPGMNLLVRGERIERVWKDGSIAFKFSPDTQVVDATGLYVLPGLINTHEHLATPPNRRFAEAQMRRDLYGGITAVRDMADDLRQVADLARASRVGEIPGPDIYYAALMAGPEFFEDPRTHAVSAGMTPGKTPWMQAIAPDTDLVQAVAMARGTAASAIKIYADLPGDTVKAITTEAHRQGIAVWAHAAVFPASPAQVLDAGVDVVSHVCMLAYQASDQMPAAYHRRAAVDGSKFGPGASPVVGKLFETMKANGQVLDATLTIYAQMDARRISDPQAPAGYCTGELAYRLTEQARRAGVVVTAGTDGFGRAEDPWPSLYGELELLVDKAHFTPLEAIRAATGAAALAVRHNPDFGTIAAGQLANLVFTAKDPSADIRALRTLTLTVKRGKAFPRADYHPQADQAARRDNF